QSYGNKSRLGGTGIRAQVKIVCHFLDHLRRNKPLRGSVGAEQGIVADNVHQARNSLGIKSDPFDRFRMEERRALIADSLKPRIDIGFYLRFFERVKPALQRDALLQLPEVRSSQLGLKLGLAHEHN